MTTIRLRRPKAAPMMNRNTAEFRAVRRNLRQRQAEAVRRAADPAGARLEDEVQAAFDRATVDDPTILELIGGAAPEEE